MRNLNHKHLVTIAKKWVVGNTACSVAFSETTTAGNNEIPDVIGFGSWAYSVVVECKTSRNDFLFDRKKKCRDDGIGMGKYRFFLCPTNLISTEDLPIGWGLIYVDEKGKAKTIFNPYRRSIGKLAGRTGGHEGFAQNLYAEHCFMYSILRRNRSNLSA
ncbi:MAG: hypothetical protein M5Z89_10100 [Olivibacter sp.]|nr:hypothetical protein [Olivibacter sp. UJ_SKK_5.1]